MNPGTLDDIDTCPVAALTDPGVPIPTAAS
jgi:hypothetical protein